MDNGSHLDRTPIFINQDFRLLLFTSPPSPLSACVWTGDIGDRCSGRSVTVKRSWQVSQVKSANTGSGKIHLEESVCQGMWADTDRQVGKGFADADGMVAKGDVPAAIDLAHPVAIGIQQWGQGFRKGTRAGEA
jgi:hypothetical protein